MHTERTDPRFPVIPPPAPPFRPQWRLARSALAALLADPKDTRAAMEFAYAVGPRMFERNFQRLLAEPAGRRLLVELPNLGDALADREHLARLSPGSFGRAYLELMEQNDLHPLGLIELQRSVDRRWQARFGARDSDPLRDWYRDRFILMHDLFHVLSGYGTDELGEAALLGFSFAQQGGRVWGFLAAATTFRASFARGPSWIPYAYRAWRRGRRAAWLPALPFEDLLHLPLTTVRHIAGIEEEVKSHPHGILRGSLDGAS